MNQFFLELLFLEKMNLTRCTRHLNKLYFRKESSTTLILSKMESYTDIRRDSA